MGELPPTTAPGVAWLGRGTTTGGGGESGESAGDLGVDFFGGKADLGGNPEEPLGPVQLGGAERFVPGAKPLAVATGGQPLQQPGPETEMDQHRRGPHPIIEAVRWKTMGDASQGQSQLLGQPVPVVRVGGKQSLVQQPGGMF